MAPINNVASPNHLRRHPRLPRHRLQHRHGGQVRLRRRGQVRPRRRGGLPGGPPSTSVTPVMKTMSASATCPTPVPGLGQGHVKHAGPSASSTTTPASAPCPTTVPGLGQGHVKHAGPSVSTSKKKTTSTTDPVASPGHTPVKGLGLDHVKPGDALKARTFGAGSNVGSNPNHSTYAGPQGCASGTVFHSSRLANVSARRMPRFSKLHCMMIEIYTFYIVVLMKVFKLTARLKTPLPGLFTRLMLLINVKYMAEIHALCVEYLYARLNTPSVGLFTRLTSKRILNKLYFIVIEIYAFHIVVITKVLFKPKTRLNTPLKGLFPRYIRRLSPRTGRKHREPITRLTHIPALTRPLYCADKMDHVPAFWLTPHHCSLLQRLNLAPRHTPLSKPRTPTTQYCRYNGYF